MLGWGEHGAGHERWPGERAQPRTPQLGLPDLGAPRASAPPQRGGPSEGRAVLGTPVMEAVMGKPGLAAEGPGPPEGAQVGIAL